MLDYPCRRAAPLLSWLTTAKAFRVALVLSCLTTADAFRLPHSRRLSRRAVLAFTPLVAAPRRAVAADPFSGPTDWGLQPELDKSAPSAHYLDNAEKFAGHLEWAALLRPGAVEVSAGESLKAEIKEFASLYRKDKYTPYGLMPGFTSLQTAYDALSAHNARYGPCKVAVPEALAGTILRNVKDARKQIVVARRREAAEAVVDAAEAVATAVTPS